MSEAVPATIKETAAALPVVSRYFPVVVAVVALAGVSLLVWRDEVRADAQIAVMQKMAEGISKNADETKELRRAFTTAGIRVRAAAAVARDPE